MSIDKIQEKKRQDACVSCGSSIIDHEKECPRCGAFPQKAYHERSASQILGISKWIQNSPTLQPNQKLTESGDKKNNKMGKISSFNNFVVEKKRESEILLTDYHLDESEGRGLNFFEEACLESGIDFLDKDEINENVFAEEHHEIPDLDSVNEGKFGKWLKNVGNKALNFVKNNSGKIAATLGVETSGPLGPLIGLLGKGISEILSKLKPGEALSKGLLKKSASENPEIGKVSDVVSKTIAKLSDEIKKDPSAFMGGKFLDSIKNLAVLSTAANQSAGQVIKDAKASGVQTKGATPSK